MQMRAHAPWAAVTRAALVRAELGAIFSNFVEVFFAIIEARWLRPKKTATKTEEVAQVAWFLRPPAVP